MNLDIRRRMPVAVGLAPFCATAGLTWATVVIGTSIDWTLYAIATGLLLISVGLALLQERGVWSFRPGSVVAALVLLAAIALLRSSAGGINSGVAVISSPPTRS